MRVLVIGGTGFLGPSLVRRLIAHGHTVSVFHRGVTPADLPSEVERILGDRHRLLEWRSRFEQLRPEIVVDAIAGNSGHAHSLLAALRGIARRLIILSSGDVYLANDILSRKVAGPLQPTPLKETAELRANLYLFQGIELPPSGWIDAEKYEKIDVERIALSDPSLPATILRLPMIYGPGDYQGWKRRFFAYWKRMDDRRAFILLNEAHAVWRAPWGYTENVAEAVALAVDNDQAAGEIYNVAEPDRLTMRDWIEEMAIVTAWSGEIVLTPGPCPPPDPSRQLNLSQHLDLDSTKIRAQLGYRELVARREALAQTVAWERIHPPRQMDAAQFDYRTEDAILTLV